MSSFTLPLLSLGSPDPSGVDGQTWLGVSCVKSEGRGLKTELSEANKSADGLKPEMLFVEARGFKKLKSEEGG